MNPAGRRSGGAVGAEVLGRVLEVVALVLLLLALVIAFAIVLRLAPTNPHNVLVRNALRAARALAGPFKDVFVLKHKRSQLVANYALATVVYLAVALVVRKLSAAARGSKRVA